MKKVILKIGTIHDYNVVEFSAKGSNREFGVYFEDDWVIITEVTPHTNHGQRELIERTRFSNDSVLYVREFQ